MEQPLAAMFGMDGAHEMWGKTRLYRSKTMADDRNGD